MSECDGCCSAVCGKPGSFFLWASSLLCFSTKGNFLIGSEASAHSDWVFISAISKVHDSKCNLLRMAVVPRVDWDSNTASASWLSSVSPTWFWGLPNEKANVEKEFMCWPLSFSKRPSFNSSHRFWKAFSESIKVMAAQEATTQDAIEVQLKTINWHPEMKNKFENLWIPSWADMTCKWYRTVQKSISHSQRSLFLAYRHLPIFLLKFLSIVMFGRRDVWISQTHR